MCYKITKELLNEIGLYQHSFSHSIKIPDNVLESFFQKNWELIRELENVVTKQRVVDEVRKANKTAAFLMGYFSPGFKEIDFIGRYAIVTYTSHETKRFNMHRMLGNMPESSIKAYWNSPKLEFTEYFIKVFREFRKFIWDEVRAES